MKLVVAEDSVKQALESGSSEEFRGVGWPAAEDVLMLSGPYDLRRRFFDEFLPDLRTEIYEKWVPGHSVEAHVDSTVASIFAAYYAVKLPVAVTVHIHEVSSMASSSHWDEMNPLLLRNVMLQVLREASEVFVSSQDQAKMLWDRFPKYAGGISTISDEALVGG